MFKKKKAKAKEEVKVAEPQRETKQKPSITSF